MRLHARHSSCRHVQHQQSASFVYLSLRNWLNFSHRTIQRLSAELRDLEAEQQKYAVTWASRQEAFGAVVTSLEELGERVKEEKSEQERKDALRDDDIQDVASKPGEDSSAEDTDTGLHVRKALDPSAPAFEPSPLRQAQSASLDEPVAESEQMDIDEAVLDGRKPRSRTNSTREEGEEEESARKGTPEV